ncbi:MAG TPA: MlaD family protein [Gemmatimonadales bacterium]|nr:MlaD family protein [Gemmatimonadales bacterium]
MKRSTFLTWEQLKVGTVVLIALAILAVAVLKLGQSQSLFSSRYTLQAYLPNANGLRVGNSVLIAGQLAGTIRRIDFLPVDDDTTRNLSVLLELDKKLQEQVREDSRARLRPDGLLGDKVLDISPGTPQFAVLQDGQTVTVGESVDYDEVLLQASLAVTEVVGLTQDLRVITGSIVEGEGTVGQLLMTPDLYQNLRGTLEEANQLLQRMQNPDGTIGRMLDDPQLYVNLTNLTGSVDSLVTRMGSSDGTIGRLIADSTLYQRLVSVSTSADSVFGLLSNGQGTAARLLQDDALYEQLSRAVQELTAVLEDLRQNPRRYTPGLIRIF